MQPTAHEIELEKETLRDIRRRSVAQVVPLDPDLPATSASQAGNSSSPGAIGGAQSGAIDDPDAVIDPSHLFWVPAHVHPELAPGEFRAFLKDHANLERAKSARSAVDGIGRRKSMLSRQYKPSANDNVEAERVRVEPRRRGSLRGDIEMPAMTIEQLQTLEQLAEEASQSDDPSQLRSVLRRSLSLNVPAPEADLADTPIIPQRPNQILRRTARTKIRKPGTQSTGAHTFQSSRRAETLPPPLPHSHLAFDVPIVKVEQEAPPPPVEDRPLSFSEEASIYDSYASYANEDEEEPPAILVDEPEPIARSLGREVQLPPALPQHQPQFHQPPIQQPMPQRPQGGSEFFTQLSNQPIQVQRSPSPPPSPSTSSFSHSNHSQSAPPTPNATPPPRKEKEKKGLFSRSKKAKDEVRLASKAEREKDKDSGFFGSIFGGSKKKQDEQPQTTVPGQVPNNQLLTTKPVKSRSASPSQEFYSPSISPSLMVSGPFARYPIHVERAVYRLSHIKLANPRRPLLEQVLISNLMFWYLGIINKAQTAANNAAANSQATPGPAATAAGAEMSEEARMEVEKREEAERVEREKAERERQERDRQEREEREAREREREQRERGHDKDRRRGSLTKAGSNGRRAEMPVRGPQYEMQHRVIEQEYRNPPPTASASQNYHRPGVAPMQSLSQQPPGQPLLPQREFLPQADFSDDFYYDYSAGNGLPNGQMTQVQPQGLPPGAMYPERPTSAPSFHHSRSQPSSPGQENYIRRRQPHDRSPSPPFNQHSPTEAKHFSNPLPAGNEPMPAGMGTRRASGGSTKTLSSEAQFPPNQFHGQRSTSGGAKLGGRSLSATAVMTNSSRVDRDRERELERDLASGGTRLKKKTSAAARVYRDPPRTALDQHAPPQLRPLGPGYGGSLMDEEEDVPLAVWQEQRRGGRR